MRINTTMRVKKNNHHQLQKATLIKNQSILFSTVDFSTFWPLKNKQQLYLRIQITNNYFRYMLSTFVVFLTVYSSVCA